MQRPHFLFGAVVATVASLAGISHAAVIAGNTADTQVSVASPTPPTDGGGTVAADGAGTIDSGRTFSNINNSVYVFQLPNLGAIPAPFTSASFTMTIAAANSIDGFNGGISHDLYGLGARPSASVSNTDFFLGGIDATDATPIQDNFINASNTNRFATNVTKTTSLSGDTALLAYLNAQYAAGTGIGNYVFLRINPDNPAGGEFDRISNYSANAVNEAFRPVINYTAVAVPEPTGLLAAAVGAPLLMRRRRA
ncbi:MAG TPA: hypothetical protein VGN72_07455 [Tepidisphaeraceae bacterium]|jgi:hypothetical protein|nr:hypothetical protein [Tepidisphaeraceae bacterium]